jgi:hypothetical protein
MCNTAFLHATTGVLLCYSAPAMGLCVSHCVAVLQRAHTAVVRRAQCARSVASMQERELFLLMH